VGLLVTVPLYVGACAQLLSLGMIERTGRRKRIFVGGAFVQMAAWVPMIAALFAPRPLGFWLLLGGFVLYFASVHFTVPAWTSVMGDLVPPAERGRFFGRRSSMCFVLQVLGVVVAGKGLQIYEQAGHEVWGFAAVFLGAMLARGFSAWHLSRMAEPAYATRDADRFTLWQFLRRLPESNFAKFVLFVACLNASAHFAGALFIPYWRDALGYSYDSLMAVLVAVLVIQVPTLVFWGRVADRYGNKKVLVATSVGIALLPGMWLLSTHLAFTIFMQVWSGFWWSGFNQSVANFLLDAVTPGKRARCTAYFNMIANTGVLVGGLAGSWAIGAMPREWGPVTLKYPFWGVLAISFALRSITLLVFLPRFREVREVPKIGTVQMLFHAAMEAGEAAVDFMAGWIRPVGDDDEPAAPERSESNEQRTKAVPP
jgi:MFS family permease